MNKPEKATIQSWLNGELEGDALREMEAWAEEHAEELEAEMGWQSLAQEIAELIPANEAPPHADFFNEQVKHHSLETEYDVSKQSTPVSFWQRLNWLLAPAALAGVALGFYLGARVKALDPAMVQLLQPEEVYTPVMGVTSEVVDSDAATVIVLEGLDDIPESIDIVMGDSSYGVSPMLLAKAEGNAPIF
ncbi:hypothetical protein ACFPK9_00785 [Rubritalea spongiae]|uniref:Anti-sigma factor n=1 Tax=Rubritalea spongiae TaxID=430797 RepID=A0ABW5E535_9BACT